MVSGATTIDELLAACAADPLEGLGDQSLARLGAAVVGMWPRLDAARLRLVAALNARHVYRVDGAHALLKRATSWLAHHGGERRGSARREVELAAKVKGMESVAKGLADGSLSKAKAAELTRAAKVSPDDQAQLVEAAKTSSAEEVARQVDRWQTEHEVGEAPIEESLTITPKPGGGRVEADLDTEGLEWVQNAVDTAAEKLGLRGMAWEKRRAKGLVAACRYFLEHADIPATRVGRPTVVVTMDVETFAARSGGSARMDSGAFVSGDVARRMACDAGIIRLITDLESMPLDLGRKTRTPTPAQCRAVIHRDRHCRFEGCTAPPWACEVHHVEFWARDGGRTDLDKLVLICWHHHGLTHKQSGTHDLTDRGDGRVRLRRRERRREETDAA